MITLDDIRERLSEIRLPRAAGSIVELGMVREVTLDKGRVTVHLDPLKPMPPQILDAMVDDIKRAVGALDQIKSVQVHVVPGTAQNAFADLCPLPGVKEIIAVASAKGGVGKSTVAVNLACALVQLGQRVGLLDADVYGPSLPTMVGLFERPRVVSESKVVPLEKYGLKLMSMGFFLDDDTPVIWRGPLVMGLVRQFLKDVDWGELDVLVIDLPPGTGDAQLTLAQQVPVSGGVIVTTPQQVSVADVQRGVAMFQQVNTPVLGVVENMSYYVCPECGKEEDVFGSGGGSRVAAEFGVPLLGQIPMESRVRAGGDAGRPVVIDRPEDPVSRSFLDIARKVLQAVEAEHQPRAPRIIG